MNTPGTVSPTRSSASDVEAVLAVASLRLARDLAAGGALWCVSPWAHHARHLAVEFVHPVLVGARAVPAVAVALDGGRAALRTATRPGDVVVLLGPGDDERLADLARRCPAWGVRCLWLAVGARPPEGLGDLVVALAEADDGRAVHDGTVVRVLHLLWELVHVCFDHLGPAPTGTADRSATDAAACGLAPADDPTSCPTCADAADVAEVTAIAPGSPTALVRIAGDRRHVDVSLVGPVAAEDLLLVHAGTALGIVDPDADAS